MTQCPQCRTDCQPGALKDLPKLVRLGSTLPGSSQASALVDALQYLLLKQFLSDLDSVEGGSFAYVVSHNPKNQTVGM